MNWKHSFKIRLWVALFVICSLVSLLLLSACSRLLEKDFVEAVGPTNLTAYAAVIHRNPSLVVSGKVANNAWHESFARRGVLQVRPYFSGILIVLDIQGRIEYGVYVASDMKETPEDGSGINFVKIDNGIYRFEQKRRIESNPPSPVR